MVNRSIQAMIGFVIGLALLPVVYGFASDLTDTGGALADTTLGALVDLLPMIYVITLVAGGVGYIVSNKR